MWPSRLADSRAALWPYRATLDQSLDPAGSPGRPFVIVGFEFTILFSVLANVLGLIFLANLPDFKGLDLYDPRCSGEHFGIVVSCDRSERDKVEEFFSNKGGEVRVFEDPADSKQ